MFLFYKNKLMKKILDIIIPKTYAAITNPAIDPQLGGSAVAENPESFFQDWVITLTTVVLVIGALLVLFYLIWGGIDWITAGGDSGKTEKARNKIFQSVIGLLVLASAYAIFFLITNFLGIQSPKNDSENGGSLNSRPNPPIGPTQNFVRK
jgi:hypothetical protein